MIKSEFVDYNNKVSMISPFLYFFIVSGCDQSGNPWCGGYQKTTKYKVYTPKHETIKRHEVVHNAAREFINFFAFQHFCTEFGNIGAFIYTLVHIRCEYG